MTHQLWMEGWSYNQSDHWAERANCNGKAYELFEYQEKDSPLAKDMTFQERRDFNLTNFELAAEICIECPVFFQCKDAATSDDKTWTVRAGEIPTRAHMETVDDGGRYCQRGHWIPDGGRCKDCKRMANRENQRARRARG